MTPSEDLFLLIRSLSQTEKAYFKKFIFNQSKEGDTVYLKLFDAIDRQKIYDEAAIKSQFKGASFTRQLTKAKYDLYNLKERVLKV